MKKLFYLSLFSVMLLNCGGDDSDNSDDEINLDDPEQVAQLLNENLNVSGNSFIVNPDDVVIDPTISVSSASAGRMPIRTGIDLINTIGYTVIESHIRSYNGCRYAFWT